MNFMKPKIFSFSCISTLTWTIINCSNVQALPTLSIKKISTTEAQANVINLKVDTGYGLSINFQKTEETITQIWLSDPSRIVFSTNSSCSKNESGSNSCNGAANVLFLRQIKPINFPNIIY